MRHKFVHEVDDDPALSDFDIDIDLPPGAKVQFSLDDGNIWVSANRAGWLHLARVCAEMALHSRFRPGYHFHQTFDWTSSGGTEPDVSFGLAEEQPDQDG